MLATRKYPAKVILFGEYTVLIGGDILAVPYHDYYSHWELRETSDQRLIDYLDYLFDLDSDVIDYKLLLQLEELVKHGWHLTSTISVGAGLGSSGSVVAAIYDHVGVKNLPIDKLRSTFQIMEGYFHGQSSGIDPLVSYLDTNIVIQSDELRVLDTLQLPQFKLYNSGIERNTQSLVSWFKSKLGEDQVFEQSIIELKLLNNSIIGALLNNEDVIDEVKLISQFQLGHLDHLVPAEVGILWNQEDNLTWKICGAGGGGYFLQFTEA